MTDKDQDPLAITLVSEVMAVEGLMRSRLSKSLPAGMELSHFIVLNHLALTGRERSPQHLAHLFNVTKGAMTNTISKLEAFGYIHIRPDWDDGRRKWISLSESGRAKREEAIRAIAPVFADITKALGPDNLRSTLPLLRELRSALG